MGIRRDFWSASMSGEYPSTASRRAPRGLHPYKKAMIQRDTTIEDLVRAVPKSVAYMRNKGIKCLACGEPMWGTIEEAAKEKGFSDADIDDIIEDLRALERDRRNL
jgi:methionine synthase II (cobalamin-independent)